MDLAPQTTAVFDELIAALGEIRDGYVLNAERFTDPLDVVEGYRYVGQLLSAASELFLEADPALLFSVHDTPLLKAVGKYRREPHDSPDGRQRVTGEFSAGRG